MHDRRLNHQSRARCRALSMFKLAKRIFCLFRFFFRAHRTNDLTKKLEKVGPFECDELEKHCRVSAKCYPTKVPALYTMTKEKFNSVFLVLLLVSRQTKSQWLMIIFSKKEIHEKSRNFRNHDFATFPLSHFPTFREFFPPAPQPRIWAAAA